jgi:hypothetical protein
MTYLFIDLWLFKRLGKEAAAACSLFSSASRDGAVRSL